MTGLFGFVFWTAVCVVAGLITLARRRAFYAEREQAVDDDAVRTIVEKGELTVDGDEPLDLREIDEEEERFWSESWEEPEEI